MEILTNENNYYGLVSDYKNGQAFKDAIVERFNARGTLAIIATVLMVPTEDSWVLVNAPGETSKVFYHAVETDIPVTEDTEEIEVEIELAVKEEAEEDTTGKPLVQNYENINVNDGVIVGENLFKEESEEE